MATSAAVSPRERAKLEMTEQIKQTAREHLARDGSNLSLRAVARDVGVVSSAVYRYFASRDDLLTALVLDGYVSLGEAVERSDAAVRRRDSVSRFTALGRAIRLWARDHPHEYALLYGSPVPGYSAPPDTIAQEQRPIAVMMDVLAEGLDRGTLETPPDRLPRAVRADVEAIAALPGFDRLPPTVIARAMTVWSLLFGVISFELFGRFTGGITDNEAWFGHQLRVMTRLLGLS